MRNRNTIITIFIFFIIFLFEGFTLIKAGNNGSVFTVSDCSHVNDNEFSVNQLVKGRLQNFDSNSDYQWTITKVDDPDHGTQVKNGNFHLGSESTKCIDLWNAAILAGDTHSEYKWEVEEKDGNNWKKVDSDNFFVNGGETTVTSTPTSTPLPNTPTNTPTPTQIINTPTPTEEVNIPTNTPTPTCGEGTCIIVNCPGSATCEVTIGSPTVSPTLTPTLSPAPTAGPSATLTVTPTPTNVPAVNGTSSNNTGIGGESAAATPQVLGASTLAATGSFTSQIAYIFFIMGLLLASLSGAVYVKAKKI